MADQLTGRPSRFQTPSAQLDLGSIASKQTRKIRVISLIVAVALHGSLAIWKVSAERRAVKPLTTRFIKREPRLVKPLELRKTPKPKRRQMRRRMKRVRAKVDTRGISRAPKASRVLDHLVRVPTSVEQAATFDRPRLEPMIESDQVRAARTTGRRLDMKLEMVDVSAFDYGRDRAMVVQDTKDRRSITGFFNIAAVHLASNSIMGQSKYSIAESYKTFSRRVGGRALADLADAFNEFTGIKVQVTDDIPASDARLLEVPWAVMSPSNHADLLPAESENIGRYLTSGGFLMVEGNWITEPRCRNLFTKSLDSAGLRQGVHWEFEILPNDHPMYHVFFDFDGAPWGGDPFTSRGGFAGISSYADEDDLYKITLERRDYMEGITLDGRLVAIYETKGYIGGWTRHWFINTGWTRGHKRNNVDIQKLGINIIVFALTQEGSIATRTVASSD